MSDNGEAHWRNEHGYVRMTRVSTAMSTHTAGVLALCAHGGDGRMAGRGGPEAQDMARGS